MELDYDAALDSALEAAPSPQEPTDDGIDYDTALEVAFNTNANTSTSKAALAIQQAYGANPDEELRRRDLARALNTPVALLPPTAKAEAEFTRNENLRIVKEAPKLGKWLENKDNARIAADDYAPLAGIEAQAYSDTHKPATAGNMLRSIVTEVKESFVGKAAGGHAALLAGEIEQLKYTTGLFKAESLPEDHPDRIAAEAKYIAAVAPLQRKYKSAMFEFEGAQRAKESVKPVFESSLGELTYDVVSGVVQTVPTIAAYILPGVGLAAGTAAALAGTQSEAFGKYAARGASWEEASLGSNLEATAEAGFALVPMSYFVNKIGGKTAVKEFFANTLGREIPTEVATYLAQSATDTAIANPDKTWEDWRNELPEGIAKTIYAATLGSALLTSPHIAARTVGERLEKAKQAEAEFNRLQQLDESVSASKLKQRSPADFKAAMSAVFDGSSVESKYLSQAELRKVLATEEGATLLDNVKGLREQLQEAEASGNNDIDIEISTSDFATYIAGTELSKSLLQHTKASPDSDTYAQAEQTLSTALDELKAMAQELSEKKILTREEFEAQGEEKPEMRVNPTLRAKIDAEVNALGTQEEKEAYLTRELYTDKLTGLPNQRAYAMSDKKAVQTVIDVDSLKWINDNVGPAMGDQVIAAVGEVLQSAGVEAYSMGGPGFVLQTEGDSAADIQKVQAALNEAVVVFEMPDGTILEKKGIDITFASGADKEQVDAELKAKKLDLEAKGERVKRGEQPKGLEATTKEAGVSVPVSTGGERRINTELREKIDTELAAISSPEARQKYLTEELLTDKLTGLGNRRAYEASDKKAVQVSIDADSLAWINTNMGKQTGDKLLKQIGVALGRVSDDAYHISGDEFYIQADTEADAQAAMDSVSEILAKAVIVLEKPDGTLLEKQGIDITYGFGSTKDEADYKLKQNKREREAKGLRAASGQVPKGISVRTPTRDEDKGNTPTRAKTYEEYLAEHGNTDAQEQLEVETVRNTIQDQLRKTNRYSKAVVETNSEPVVQWYKTMAARAGITPTALYKKYPLKVTEAVGAGYAQKDSTLFQGNRGAFDPSSLTISLLKNADLSTFVHESAHFYLQVMEDLALSSTAPAKIVEDFNKVMVWFGVDPAKWGKMTTEQKRQYHEQWAESYERWLLEGKAPTIEMQTLFSRLRSWMLSTYKSVEEFIRKNPASGKLNDDIRGVFTRMIAAESAVNESEQVLSYQKLLTSLVEDPSAKAELTELGELATQRAVADMERRSISDMKWASGAKNRALKELQATADKKRKAIKEEVAEAVKAEPVYQAITALKDKDTNIKLHTGLVKELLPDLDIAFLRGMTNAHDGVSPDQVADMFGFASGLELINNILAAEPMQSKIDGLTDKRMLEENGELVDKRAVDHAANLAVHNSARTKFMATGLSILTSPSVPPSQLAKAAKLAAAEIIAKKEIRSIKPKQYEMAETKAVKEVIRLVAKDPKGAARAQQAALINNRLVRTANEALEEVDSGVKRAKNLQKKTAQANMRGDALVQLNAFLDRFDLREGVTLKELANREQTLEKWLEDNSDKLSAVLPDIPAWVLNEANRKHYKQMTMEEFRGVMDVVKGFELLARREEKQYQAIRDMDFKEERDAVLNRLREFNPEVFAVDGAPKEIKSEFVKTISSKLDEAKSKLYGEFINPETIVNVLEGGNFGQLHESLLGRISKRVDWKAERMGQVYAQVKELFSQYTILEKRAFSRKQIGKIGGDPITRENAVVIALLHGNKEGRERLANYGWSEAEQASTVGLLNEKDHKLVEGIWKLFDQSLWPELKELNERTRGKAPPKVEPVPFFVNGMKFTGGYFKLAYDTKSDPRMDALNEVEDLKALRGGSLGMNAKTAQGSSTERKDNVSKRPRIDLSVFAEAVSETVHDLALREAVFDTSRLLNDKGIRNAIINAAGEHGYKAIVQRLRDVAARPKDPSGFIEKAATVARKNTVVALMSGLGTALQNVTGVVPALGRVNPGVLTREIARFSMNPLASIALVQELSSYMKNRHTSFDRELLNETKKLTGKAGILPDVSTMLWFMAQTDKIVNVPIWLAAYHDGMKKFENDSSKAVDYADHLVRQTQGSGREADLAQIMAGGPLRKVFTMFYSYFNAQLGALVRSGALNKKLIKQNPALAVALFTKDFLLIIAIPAILSKLVFTAPSEEEDEKTYFRRSLDAIGSYGLAMFPLIRDIGNYYWGQMDEEHKSFGYKATPIQSAVEGVGKGVGALKDIVEGDGTTTDVKDAIMGVSFAFGLPGKLIANTVTGTNAVLEGEAGPSALIYGAPQEK